MLPRIRFVAIAFAAVFAVCAAAGCRPKAGQECSDTPGSCIDKTSHAVCVNKKYVIETCKGKNACNDDGKSLVCDNTIGDVGDVRRVEERLAQSTLPGEDGLRGHEVRLVPARLAR